jgi:hypothetical protein
LTEKDKQEMVELISNTMDGKKVYTEFSGGGGNCICTEWMFSNSNRNNNELVYITEVKGILGDAAVLMHTKKVFENMGIHDKCKIFITKPLTKKIAMF